MFDSFGSAIVGTRAASAALDVTLKATALMTLAFACHYALGRRRPLIRSALWNACLVGLLLLPAAGLAFPRMYVTVPPIRNTEVEASPSREAALPAIASAEETVFLASAPTRLKPLAPRMTPIVPEPAPTAWQRPRIDGIDVAFGLYLSIATFLGMRLAVALAGVVGLRRRCLPVDDSRWTEALDRWRARLGISRDVALLASDRVSVPVVVAWFRPAIILPKGLVDVDAANSVLIDAVLLHELGHVKRGDFGWNVVRKLVQLVYWPHPLVWPVGRVVDRVREQACDDLCVHGLGGSDAYRASLIEVAAGLVRRPETAMGLAMARSTNLEHRLDWIDRSRGASRCLLRWPGRFSVAVTVVIVAGVLGSIEFARATVKAARAAEEQKAETVPDQPPAIEVTVRAKDTGKVLAGASVRTSIDMAHYALKADRDGRVRVDLSKRTFRDTFNIDVWADGYVQQRHFYAQNDARYPKIPAKVTIDLLPAEQTLGGKVTDEQGKPIAGVTVEIWGYLGEKKQKDELAYMVDATTDAQGQWRCRCFRGMTFAYLHLKHPDYLTDDSMHMRRHGRPTPSTSVHPEEKPMEGLRDFSDVQIMTRGVEIAGEIRDDLGRPIPGAEVGWLEVKDHDTFHDDMPTTTADEKGRFRFPHVRSGKLVLQVKAKGHAPELKPVEAKAGAEPVAIDLGPARTLEGRVIDSQGKPIPDAFIAIDTWRAYRAIGVFLKSDADGRFRWEDAPPDMVRVNASCAGFEGVIWRNVSAREQSLFILNQSLSISGRILDARTNKPIEKAIVEFGFPDAKSGEYKWGENTGVYGSQGRLQAQVNVERTPEFRLRVRAAGYESFASRTFRAGEPSSELNVNLNPTGKPGDDIVTGVVHRPDGTPLAGAEVAITYPLIGRSAWVPVVHIKDGKFHYINESYTSTQTDQTGRFRITREPDPQGEHFAVVVRHPDFQGEVNRAAWEANSTIATKPWGRIEGVARVGTKPASGASIAYFADRRAIDQMPYVSESGETKADAEGRFIIERVMPGDVRVSIRSGEGPNGNGSSYGKLMEVKSGETTRTEIGGKGRPVIAKIALPTGFDPKADYLANSRFSLQSDRPMVPSPKERLSTQDAALSDWTSRWMKSPEGYEYRRRYYMFSDVKLRDDGTIRVDDVPPGEYRLKITYSAETIYGGLTAPERIAFVNKQFTIPEIPGGRTDEPFDLGVLHPMVKQTLKVGQPAPAFDVETLDGGRVKLADFRGKYVLVDFWATWCVPCIAEIPDLKAVHDRFGKDDRFAMLSLSLDAAKDAPRKFVAEKGLPWKQGFLGEWAEGGVPEDYHVESIPAMFLVGPDGMLKAANLRGDMIGAAVAEALKQP